MCYFHMKANIKNRKSGLPQSEYITIMNEISKLHLCINEDEYSELLDNKLKRWKSVLSLLEFYNYFI